MPTIETNGLPKSKRALTALKTAKRMVFPSEVLRFEESKTPQLSFDLKAEQGYRTLGPSQFHKIVTLKDRRGREYKKQAGYLNPEIFVAHALIQVAAQERLTIFGDKTLFLDTETLSVVHRWNVRRDEFFRLGQFAFGEGEVILTEEIGEVLEAISQADLVVGHNLISFDLSYLLGDEAMGVPTFDTMIQANIVTPAPHMFKNSSGKSMMSNTPASAMRFYGLENLCHQFGIEGKHGDLKEMAARHDCDIGEIPMDEEFREYARQDVVAVRDLARAYWSVAEPTAYEWREQELAHISAQIQRNGFRVDRGVAQARVDELAERKEAILSKLQKEYDFPTSGKMPWRSKAGKEALFAILQDHGIDKKELPKTATGNPSLGGDALKSVTEGTKAEELGITLAELMGQRSLAELALMSTHGDGFTHPNMTSFQVSGRYSVTQPGLTVWTSRGPGVVEKSYFIPDDDDHVLVSFDYSAADQRIVAGYSQDSAYMKVFEDDLDLHEMAARLTYGEEVYDTTPNARETLREDAKAMNHAYAYGSGASTLAETAGVPLRIAELFVEARQKAFPGITKWQFRCRQEGSSGTLVNDWGRPMPVDVDRSYTQSPALLGQSGTREIMSDALIRLRNAGLLQYVKVVVHDEIICSFPKDRKKRLRTQVRKLMTDRWKNVDFPVNAGNFASNWMEAGH